MSDHDAALFKRQLNRAMLLDSVHLNCRVGGDRHHWHLVQPDWSSGTTSIEKASQCSQCLTVKREEITPRTGEIIKRHYEYPKGYLTKRVEGDGPEKLMSAGAVRLATLSRSRKLAAIQDFI
jgi:hypothetical protein